MCPCQEMSKDAAQHDEHSLAGRRLRMKGDSQLGEEEEVERPMGDEGKSESDSPDCRPAVPGAAVMLQGAKAEGKGVW